MEWLPSPLCVLNRSYCYNMGITWFADAYTNQRPIKLRQEYIEWVPGVKQCDKSVHEW